MSNFLLWTAWYLGKVPWEVVAAFMAVGVAIWVAFRQTREGRQQLRRQAIADVHAASSRYITAAGALLRSSRSSAQEGKPAADWMERLADLTEANTQLDRALTFAGMTCTESTLVQYIEGSQDARRQIITVLARKYVPTSEADRRRHVEQLVQDISKWLSRFNSMSAAVVHRGSKLYALRTERTSRKIPDLGDLSRFDDDLHDRMSALRESDPQRVRRVR